MNSKKYLLLASTKGIGFGIAKELVKKNYKVYLGSRNQENLQNALNQLNSIKNQSAIGSIVDIHSSASIEKWCLSAIEKLQSFDGVLINYGGPPTGKFFDFDEKTWQNSFEYMLLNPIRLLKTIYAYLKENSSILFVTSFSVKEPVENLILSNVFRSAVTALMKSLSKEWGPKIRLNCILPGRIDTDRIREIDLTQSKKENVTTEEIKRRYEEKIPLKRYGSIEEIGKVGAFLLCEESNYVTGTNIQVDGGMINFLL